MNFNNYDHTMVNLGVDQKLDKWIEVQKINRILVNSPVTTREKLESTQKQLLEMQSEIGEKFFMILNNIPDSILSQLPGFDREIFTRLKILNQLVKARIRQTKRKLSTSTEESQFESYFEKNFRNNYDDDNNNNSNRNFEKNKSLAIDDNDYDHYEHLKKKDISLSLTNSVTDCNEYSYSCPVPNENKIKLNDSISNKNNKRGNFQLKKPLSSTLLSQQKKNYCDINISKNSFTSKTIPTIQPSHLPNNFSNVNISKNSTTSKTLSTIQSSDSLGYYSDINDPKNSIPHSKIITSTIQPSYFPNDYSDINIPKNSITSKTESTVQLSDFSNNFSDINIPINSITSKIESTVQSSDFSNNFSDINYPKNSISSKIESTIQPSSSRVNCTDTSQTDCDFLKNTYVESDDIINVDASKIFMSSIMCNDSDDENFDNKSDLVQSSKVENKKSPVINFIGENVKNDDQIFNNLDFAHCSKMLDLFKDKFGLHQFRPNQLAAINAACLGHDCFILMPTGGGKSLCYQLPALISPGVTIVISPLRSLIVDQKQKLESLDISVMHMTADLSQAEVRAVYRKLSEVRTDLKLLYVTPEKISLSPKFLNALKALYVRGNLARFVIDEVHCVSQWGHDFRPDYNKLSKLKQNFPDVPIMALTATATERVRSDILHQLHLNDSCKWFISSFNRPNLRYSVIPKRAKSSNQQVVELIKNKFKNECGIVYCISRKDCDTCAETLSKSGIIALSYHAGLEDKLRVDRQTLWISEKVKVICATIAFGMGIDKPNVRFVIHAALPKSMEGYYQESGRAGRDNEPADCILLYNYGDVYRYRNIIERGTYTKAAALKTHLDNLCKIVHYCDNLSDCRRAMQLNYFGEKFDRQECIALADTTCDNCKTFDRFVDVDVTKDAKSLVELICSVNRYKINNVTILQVVDIYKGSDISNITYKLGPDYRKWFGQGKAMTKHEIERLLHKLIVDGYLCENMQLNNGIVCAYVVPGPLSNEILFEDNVQIFMQRKKIPEKTNKKVSNAPQMSAVASAELKDLEQRCYTALVEMVSGIAGALDVSANSIMNMTALRVMSQQLPCTEAEMLNIPHVTQANFDKYGKALLDITQKFAKEKKEILTEEDEQRQIMEIMEFDDIEEFENGPTKHFIGKRPSSKGAYKRCKTPKRTPPKKKFKSNGDITPWVKKMNPGTSGKPILKISKTPKKSRAKFVPKKSLLVKNNRNYNTNNNFNNNASNNGPGLCELTKKK